MKGIVFVTGFILLAGHCLSQKTCVSYDYQQKEMQKSPAFQQNQQKIEAFTRNYIDGKKENNQARLTESAVIKIPVVVHILYHYPGEKISDEVINSQIAALNRDFRKMNADTSIIPSYFKPLAADCKVEFQLAKSDSRHRSTTGIIRKYTPITKWDATDKMKFDSEMGSDAWDANSYLNIWVCALDQLAGYSSLPGGPAEKDGIVIDFGACGMNNPREGHEKGRTAVHEAGHWLNLKHIWGDSDCGDDAVDDTPKQEIYTVGCPTGIRTSCSNGPNGTMYMNYMDFTSDACINLFTAGQKLRMRSLFAPGGARESLLSSKGLDAPLIFETPLPEEDPKWLFTKVYPNPALGQLTINMDYDVRWIGKTINVTNMHGQTVMQLKITLKVLIADISRLQPGVYFLTAKKEDGDIIRHKFIKL
jgi:hypothetical protein